MVEKVEPAADRSIHSELSHVKTVTPEGVILQFSEMTLNTMKTIETYVPSTLLLVIFWPKSG